MIVAWKKQSKRAKCAENRKNSTQKFFYWKEGLPQQETRILKILLIPKIRDSDNEKDGRAREPAHNLQRRGFKPRLPVSYRRTKETCPSQCIEIRMRADGHGFRPLQ